MKMVIGFDLNFGNVMKLDFGLDLNFELRFEFGSSFRILYVYSKYMNFCKEYAYVCFKYDYGRIISLI